MGSPFPKPESGHPTSRAWVVVGAAVFAACSGRAADSVPLGLTELPLDSISQVWAATATNIYVTGGFGLVRYSAGRWKDLEIVWDSPPEYSERTIPSVGGTGADDVWIADMYHFDGSSWDVRSQIGREEIRRIRRGADGRLYAVGKQAVYRAEGAQWKMTGMFSGLATFSVWTDHAGDSFMVGLMEPWAPGTGVTPRFEIQRLDGTQWIKESSGQPGFVMDLWGGSDGSVYAVGFLYPSESGVLVKRQGQTWSPVQLEPGTPSLYRIHGTAESGLFVCGDDAVYRLEDDRLVPFHTDPTMRFTDVHVVDDHVLIGAEPKEKGQRSALLVMALSDTY